MKKENTKLKAILYFLAGLFFNFLGLIIGGLWIKFKAKTNQRTKFIALIIGFGVFALFSYIISPYILEPQAERFLYSKYPEMEKVKTAVGSKYPDGKVGLGANWNKSFGTGQEATTTATLTVDYTAKRALSGKEIQDMGKLACTTLQSTGKKYDEVGIVSTQDLLPVNIPFATFNKTIRITATCEEWFNKNFSNFPSQL